VNVLAVGAHHDDIELGCGGTLARLAREGHRTFGLVLTNSETHYDFREIHRTSAVARREAERAADVLGLTLVDLPGFGQDNGTLGYDVELMRRIERFIDEQGISLVFSHWNHDLNTDHEAAAKLTRVASRRVPSVLMYRSNWYQTEQPFNGTFFVDVSETIEVKRQSLGCFESELANRGHDWIESFFDAHKSAGFAIGKRYAEVFEPLRYELLPGTTPC
jgi:LmbE family N-acetylglucosaminyl deacetylase